MSRTPPCAAPWLTIARATWGVLVVLTLALVLLHVTVLSGAASADQVGVVWTHLEITDDVLGLPEGHQTGVGLTSMRERATELGGACVVEARPEGGMRVLAQLPLSRKAVKRKT